jgi:hypothetical protein
LSARVYLYYLYYIGEVELGKLNVEGGGDAKGSTARLFDFISGLTGAYILLDDSKAGSRCGSSGGGKRSGGRGVEAG